MSLIMFLLFGALVGWLASIVMKTNGSQGVIADIILGILGSMVGGYLMQILGFGTVSGFNLYSIIVGVIGSIVLIAVGRALKGAFR